MSTIDTIPDPLDEEASTPNIVDEWQRLTTETITAPEGHEGLSATIIDSSLPAFQTPESLGHISVSSPPEDRDSSSSSFSMVEQSSWDPMEISSQVDRFESAESALQLWGRDPLEDQGIWLDPFPLSPGPLYSSPTDKAAGILDMCKTFLH